MESAGQYSYHHKYQGTRYTYQPRVLVLVRNDRYVLRSDSTDFCY